MLERMRWVVMVGDETKSGGGVFDGMWSPSLHYVLAMTYLPVRVG